jgi:hypothetical protein
VIRIDRNTGRILWKLGAPPLSGQHAPTLLTNGNILIFDNGPHRLDESFVNPYFGPAHLPEKQQNNGVFRVDRYSEDEVDRMRRV